MENGLKARLGVVLFAVLASIWVLIPTFLSPEDQARIEAAAAREKDPNLPPPETPDPWYIGILPNTRINLGLDLQGGIDLTLEVEADEAVLSTVQRDIPPLKMAFEREGVAVVDVRRERRKPSLMVAPGEGVTLEQVQKVINDTFRYYVYAHSSEENGKSYLIFEMNAEEQDAIAKRAVEQALETIRNRVDETGVKEPDITRKGERGIDVQLPGETDVDQAVAAIGTTARLEFILVDEAADMPAVQRGVDAAKETIPAEDYNDDRILSEWLIDNGHLPANRRLFWEYAKNEAGVEERAEPLVLLDQIILTGDDVNDAQTANNPQSGDYYVALEFKPRGSAIFSQVTGDNVGKRFAIVLDGKVKSAPVIRERIPGVASIQMGGQNVDEQLQQASTLALVLRSGALPAPVSVGEVRTVGATLGAQAVEEGVFAALAGSLLVFIFAAWYYRVSGLVADVALGLNAVFVAALLSLLGATLTLPGICGMALTVGMAVDCNIIIYERIREELRAGKGVRAAIDAGFDRAFVAVLDSNLTTLLAGIVLYSYGSGPIRGFAVTLMIGIFTTLFTGVFVSRTLIEFVNSGRKTSMSI